MAKDTAGYTLESKQLVTAIGKCLAIIALGDRAESNNIVLHFTKRGLSVEAQNSVASYRSDVVVEIDSPVNRKVSLLPEMIQSYANTYPKLTLVPKEDHLMVKGGRGFTASIYYIGENELVAVEKPEEAEDISSVASLSNELLALVDGMKNRTDKQQLGVILEWGGNALDMVVGDSHHAVVAHGKLKQKSTGSLTMALPNLRKIMDIGQNFAIEGEVLKAWSETEYLTLNNQTENVFLADTAKEALTAKRTTITVMKTDTFREMVNVLTGAVSENALVSFEFSEKEIKGSVSTDGGRAVKRDKPTSFKGKPKSVSVSIHHLRDCLSTVKTKEVKLVLYGTMLSLESSTEKVDIKAVMAATASI